jgi:transmembrane sensor
MSKNKISEPLLASFINGNCTLEEKAEVISWYNTFENNNDAIADLNIDQKNRLKYLMLNKINNGIDAHQTKKNKLKATIYWLSGVAASLLIVFAIYYQNNVNQSLTGNNIKEAKVIVLENQGNSIYKRVLEDGSIIWLSPKSKVEIPEHFANNVRVIKMDGKVFFEVSKNLKRPFLVYAKGTVTKVLGTSFLINAQNEQTQVLVVTGKVLVSSQERSNTKAFLLPNQKVVYNPENQSLQREKINNVAEIKMWQKPALSFDNQSISNVIDVLATSFNLKIDANSATKNCKLTADFTNQNLPDILEMLCKSIDATYEIKEGVVNIYGKGCN